MLVQAREPVIVHLLLAACGLQLSAAADPVGRDGPNGIRAGPEILGCVLTWLCLHFTDLQVCSMPLIAKARSRLTGARNEPLLCWNFQLPSARREEVPGQCLLLRNIISEAGS